MAKRDLTEFWDFDREPSVTILYDPYSGEGSERRRAPFVEMALQYLVNNSRAMASKSPEGIEGDLRSIRANFDVHAALGGEGIAGVAIAGSGNWYVNAFCAEPFAADELLGRLEAGLVQRDQRCAAVVHTGMEDGVAYFLRHGYSQLTPELRATYGFELLKQDAVVVKPLV